MSVYRGLLLELFGDRSLEDIAVFFLVCRKCACRSKRTDKQTTLPNNQTIMCFSLTASFSIILTKAELRNSALFCVFKRQVSKDLDPHYITQHNSVC